MAISPYDEDRIGADDIIIRRINPEQHVIWDENRQRHRISSNAYRKSSGLTGGMSIDVEALMLAEGQDARSFVTTPVFTGSVSFAAGAIRALELWVGYEPIENIPDVPDNPYHGEVWARAARKHFSEAQKSGLAQLARWYVELPDVDVV